MKKVFMLIGIITGTILLVFFAFLIVCTIKDYKPQIKEIVSIPNKIDTIQVNKPFSVMIWNIGYAGLDKDMDFFYDKGKKVRPVESKVNENLEAITHFLKSNDSIDFFMLQEVDVDAKRSYYIDEVKYISQQLDKHKRFFSLNYNVNYVPMPIYDPMGKVKAGIATFSSYSPMISVRYSFPFNFKWPLKLFMLDRCFMTTRYKTSNKKDFVLINTHNSAFDEDGNLRKAELDYLKKFLLKEYNKGNYVIVGGDFNQSPFGLKTDFEGEPFDFEDFVTIPDTLLPKEWKFVFDNRIPSNRRTASPYVKGETKVTLIDFFIVSPNIIVDTISCLDLNFEYSDHNPVVGTFKLME